MKNRYKLDVNGFEEDFFAGTYLLGIVSSLKNYRFIWKINSVTGFDFRLNADAEIQLQRKNRNYFFSLYAFFQPETETEHHIYLNQYEGEYLLPEFKHIDFLWLMRGNMFTDDDVQHIQTKLKSIEQVQLVAEMTHEKIRNKGNLLF